MASLGYTTSERMGFAMKTARYIKLMMAGGSILLFISAFLPFAFFVIPVSVTFISGIVRPFDIWWFGYPLMIIGIGTLFLSIFNLSGKNILICTIFGVLLSAVAFVAIPLSFFAHWQNVVIVPYAFLTMLIGGLILAVLGMRTVLKSRYSLC